MACRHPHWQVLQHSERARAQPPMQAQQQVQQQLLQALRQRGPLGAAPSAARQRQSFHWLPALG